ncbi:siderophore-interacting protein [Pedobacter sp. AW31-3R]|uniref:siderophore-interacting protein n=1 Tax=Pedobacter sp. AW31-3R TaxID=3445781 RepID=UPI003FA177A2
MNDANQKPGILRGIFKVKRKVFLTPHYIRVILEGSDLQLFSQVTVGVNNKVFIPVDGAEKETVRRTYTLRALDMKAGEMTVDFVAHGEEGPASAWAIHAKPGDTIEIAMKDKSNPLYPEADWYLLAGDHTALPVISVILETLPAAVTGIAIIHVSGLEDMLEIETKSKVQIKWIFDNQHKDSLLEAVANVIIPREVSKYVFAAAESGVIKSMRTYFTETGITREELSAQAYWKLGVAED